MYAGTLHIQCQLLPPMSRPGSFTNHRMPRSNSIIPACSNIPNFNKTLSTKGDHQSTAHHSRVSVIEITLLINVLLI